MFFIRVRKADELTCSPILPLDYAKLRFFSEIGAVTSNYLSKDFVHVHQ